MVLVVALLACQWLLFAVVWQTHNVNWLLAASLLQTLFAPLYGAADLMVYRNWPAHEVGSITSSLSFIRNMYAGCLMFFSGQLIVWGGTNYKWAFILGIAMSTLALPFFFLHGHLMRRKPAAPANPDQAPASAT